MWCSRARASHWVFTRVTELGNVLGQVNWWRALEAHSAGTTPPFTGDSPTSLRCMVPGDGEGFDRYRFPEPGRYGGVPGWEADPPAPTWRKALRRKSPADAPRGPAPGTKAPPGIGEGHPLGAPKPPTGCVHQGEPVLARTVPPRPILGMGQGQPGRGRANAPPKEAETTIPDGVRSANGSFLDRIGSNKSQRFRPPNNSCQAVAAREEGTRYRGTAVPPDQSASSTFSGAGCTFAASTHRCLGGPSRLEAPHPSHCPRTGGSPDGARHNDPWPALAAGAAAAAKDTPPATAVKEGTKG